MTHSPRSKYPSNSKNYHDLRRSGYAHTVRLPEELLGTYVVLKRALRAKTSYIDVIYSCQLSPSLLIVVLSVEPVTITDSQQFPAEDESRDINRDLIEEDPGAESPNDISDDEMAEGETQKWRKTMAFRM
ncbi:hypothetical protein R1sor_010885 [Riccia sorocarpa]|uniref:Uncharacterized protein n=1 Tax=Riccia sorocarpa TaxID=122646 RepID=A0ABD3I2R7_9MARC